MATVDLQGLSITLVALLIAACSLAATVVGLRRRTTTDYTGELEGRLREKNDELREQQDKHDQQIQELRGEQILMARDLKECKDARNEFQQQNFALMAELLALRRERG